MSPVEQQARGSSDSPALPGSVSSVSPELGSGALSRRTSASSGKTSGGGGRKTVEPTEGSSLAGFAGPASRASSSASSGHPPGAGGASLEGGTSPGLGLSGVAHSSALAGSSQGAAATAAMSRHPSRALDFPVLPAAQSLPYQTVQTPTQVESILSLPPSLLLHLARTPDHSAQQAIAQKANAVPYLSAMTLPPPSPTHLVQGFAGITDTFAGAAPPMKKSVTNIGDHPAIPLLLGQAWSPPTSGIIAPSFTTTPSSSTFQPIFASVEDWSHKTAREHVNSSKARPSAALAAGASSRPGLQSSHSFTEREIETVARQLKSWALTEEERGIGQQVQSSKEAAVLLASHVNARSRLLEAATNAVQTSDAMVASGHQDVSATSLADSARTVLAEGVDTGAGVDNFMKEIDLTPYAEPFKHQLAALASGYFAQLHREALNRLLTAAEDEDASSPSLASSSTGRFPTSQPPSGDFGRAVRGTEQGNAMHVRAAASAAIAANVLAAKEMAAEAGSQLTSMGVDVPSIVPERTTGGLASLEVRPTSIAATPTSLAAAGAQPPPAPQAPMPSADPTSAVDSEVSKLLTPGGGSACTEEMRDYFLSYAHSLYSTDPSNQYLLPVLHTLEEAHPRHLPTLLLMSCVYYSRGQLESSLYYNQQLLKYEPHYVEAMSNIGTTLRAMGRWKDAEGWWWKAIKLRPTYWDATENLLGVLCNSGSTPTVAGHEPPPTAPRYKDALALCEFIEGQLFGDHALRPRVLPASVPTSHVHRLQNLFYAKGNVNAALRQPIVALDEYSKAIELALSLPSRMRERVLAERGGQAYAAATLRDLVVATTVLGMVLASYASSGGQPTSSTQADIVRLGLSDSKGQLRLDRLFSIVQSGGDRYVSSLFTTDTFLPTVLLQPGEINRFLGLLFSMTGGALPALSDLPAADSSSETRPSSQLANQTTSTMLLTIAKIFQDYLSSPNAALKGITLGGIPISQSVLLPLYYVALALHPSPSTYNNLGILLSTMNATTLVAAQPGAAPTLLNGQQLALQYYRAGLLIDPRHPHLYTNLGSLLKDMGQLQQAVQMYKQAVEYNPTFDVALANLANAIKDTGHIQESIPFYRRAVAANPAFPEAICGLVNALGGVCDWIGRGGVNEAWVVDNEGKIVASPVSPPGEVVRQGYLGQISELIAKQLSDGHSYGVGALRGAGDPHAWLANVSQAIWNLPPDSLGEAAEGWVFRFEALLGSAGRPSTMNEGGFIIRLVERLMRRIQRRWYLTAFGKALDVPNAVQAIAVSPGDIVTYRRPQLPPSLPIPPVPTVLPFHVFTYPASPRETRLISHRTGLRISHSTLTQPWLPQHIYPPPAPPVGGKINIGYVSSDLGNHPLSHLMQSVFGFHDLNRFNVFCYATSPSDNSPYRIKIEAEAQHFVDVSSFSTQAIVERIVTDQIHILVNLSGYTKGARNEVFACRPAPVQMSYMGFAGTLSAGWCDYFVVDPIVCPPSLVSGNIWRQKQGYTGLNVTEGDGPSDFEGDPDPEGGSEDFVYTEKLIYMPHSYFVTDHRQSWFDDESPPPPGSVPIARDQSPERIWTIEENLRWEMRKAMFPTMRDDTIIFANWNQLYKIDPFVFRIWLNILTKHPNSVLWLLRFPAPGEQHLKETAARWAGSDVAERIIFTDVTNKNEHIRRGRIPDLFLDTTECNAHTTACDALAQGTPVLTWPRHLHKLCSRVAASVVVATGFGEQMIVRSEEDYERRALALATSLTYDIVPIRPGALPSEPEARVQRRGKGELSDLRRNLFLTRRSSPLFDTKRWVRNMESGYVEAWRRWVHGTEFEDSAEWEDSADDVKQSGCIWVADEVDGTNVPSRSAYFT